jgi:virulence-associated protein VagC
MAIVKSLSQAPMGLDDEMMSDEIMSEEPDIEIEIEDPERVEIGVGGLEIVIEPGKDGSEDFNANIAEEMDEDDLVSLAGDLLGEFEEDISSRKDYMQTYVDGLEKPRSSAKRLQKKLKPLRVSKMT